MKRVADILSSILPGRDGDQDSLRRKAVGSWRTVAGEHLGSLSEAIGFRGETLIVRVEHPAVGMELRMRSASILEELNSIAGITVFRAVKIVYSKGRQ